MADLLSTADEARTFARLEVLQASQARVFAEQAQLLADLVQDTAVRFGASKVDKHLALEIAGLLRLGQGRAMRLATNGLRLREQLPRTLAGLADGSVWVAQAQVLLFETRHASPSVVTETERRVFAAGGQAQCPSDLRKLIAHHLLAVEAELEPGATAQREADAFESRRVDTHPEPDGMSSLHAHGSAEQLALHTAALDVLCAQAKVFDEASGVVRTAAQRRLDVLMELPPSVLAWQRFAAAMGPAGHGAGSAATGSGVAGRQDGGDRGPGTAGPDGAGSNAAASSAHPGTDGVVPGFGPLSPFAPGSPFAPIIPPPHLMLNLHLPMASALGLSEEPGLLDGYGPISAAHVRRLLPEAHLRKVVVDGATGLPLAVDEPTPPAGTHRAARERCTSWVLDDTPYLVDDTPEPRYRASRKLKDLVFLRDMRCSGPGCGQAAHRCDFEHRIPYDHTNPERGGQTSAANGGPVSDRCHDEKTHGGWTLTRHEDGSTSWHSPKGRSYRRPAFWRPPPVVRPNARLRPPDDPALLGRLSPRGPTDTERLDEHESRRATNGPIGLTIDAALTTPNELARRAQDDCRPDAGRARFRPDLGRDDPCPEVDPPPF